MPEPYIRARGLTKTYLSGTSDLVVFENLDLDVERGEMLALVGRMVEKLSQDLTRAPA